MNLKPLATFLAVSLTACLAGQLKAKTIAYYRFEEGANGMAATVANSILDSSGNGLNGTPYGVATYTNSVPANPIPLTGTSNLLSLDFDGSSGRIFIPDYPQLALTNSLTLEAFINASAPGGGCCSAGQIIMRGDDRPDLDPYQIYLDSSSILFAVTDQNNNLVSLTAPISLHQWHHVAGTLDGTTGNMSLYIDGILVASRNTTVRPFGPLTGPNPGLGIGNVESASWVEYFNGAIDEVRISDVALTPSEFLNAQPAPQFTFPGIALVGNQIAVFWPASMTNYTLQSTSNLLNPAWAAVSNGVPLTGVILSNVGGPDSVFFRLQGQ